MHVLATGSLKPKNNASQQRRGGTSKYTICYLSEKHLPAIMNLQDIIVQNLGRPDLLQTFSYDFMKQHMGHQGIVLGVFVDNCLIAFRNVYFPDRWDREWNLGIDIGLPTEELSKVANLQMVCVHPDFRGHALAWEMNNVSLKILKKKRYYYHICATVSPYNLWNIRILLNSGFHIVRLKDKYGGKLRYVVHQNIHHPVRCHQQPLHKASLDDLETQKMLLSSGFCGVTLSPKERMCDKNKISSYNLIFKSPVQVENTFFQFSTPALWEQTQEDHFSAVGLNCYKS